MGKKKKKQKKNNEISSEMKKLKANIENTNNKTSEQ